MARLFFASFLILAAASAAHADVIAPPPERCPEGSTAVDFCHGPPTCQVATCATNAECGAGMECAEKQLCVTENCCSGRCCGGGCGMAPTVYTHVIGSCEGGAACTGGTCQPFKICVPSTPGMDGGAADDSGVPPAEDSGTPPGEDSGTPPGEDSGSGGEDSGTPGTDAGGGGGSDDGGCCAVFGGRQAGAIPLLMGLAVVGVFLGRRRR